MAEAKNSVGANAEATKDLWLVAFGSSIPLALILFAASPLGTNFIYVMLGIPALLLVWVMIAIISLMLGVRSAMKKAWRRSFTASFRPIILPDHQSADWLAHARHSELSCEGYSAHPLWAHYYLVSFTC
jgi:hypothetical protein